MSDPILDSFREELLALVQTLEAGLLGLEDARGSEVLGDVFRAAHNIKSAAAMLGLSAAADTAHRMENVLDALRGGTRALDARTVGNLLSALDALRALVRGDAAAPSNEAALAALDETGPAPAAQPLPSQRKVRVALHLDADALARALDPLMLLSAAAGLGEVESARVDASALPPLAALDPERLHLGFELVLRTRASVAALRDVFLFAEGAGRIHVEELEEPREEAPAASIETLVVGARRVDALVDLSAELLVAASRVEHLRHEGVGAWDARMEGACQDTLRLAARVQEASMRIRLVPLEPTFVLLRRFVREAAERLGKQVEVELRGGQTELDKAVAERLLGPLKHLARNALDHGIESPAERAAHGKPTRGRLLLSAREERGQVVLAVEDDGRGIDPVRVQQVGAARGLCSPDGALSDAEALQLIFTPGFSTAGQVGALSGRGVGLDVVRRNLVELGGDLRVLSQVGRSTRFTLCVPLTLAVLEGMVVAVDGERLVVPRDVVVKLVRLSPGQVSRLPDGRSVVRLPDETLPLVRPRTAGAPPPPSSRGVALVADTPEGRVALHADEVLSMESVLLKPLHRGLRMGEGVLGAAVLGDGRVALVLDVAALTGGAPEGGAEVSVLRGGKGLESPTPKVTA